MNFLTLNRIFSSSTKLLDEVQRPLSRAELQVSTHELIALRREVEQIKFHKVAEVTRNVELYRMFGNCQNLQLSLQSKLIEKARTALGSENALYSKIESIFSRIYGEAPFKGFGERLVKADITNLLVLEALNDIVCEKEKVVTPLLDYNKFIHQCVDPIDYELFNYGKTRGISNEILHHFEEFELDKDDNPFAMERFVLQNFSHPSIRALLLEKVALPCLDLPLNSWHEKYKELPSLIRADIEEKYHEMNVSEPFSQALPSAINTAIEMTRAAYCQEIAAMKEQTKTLLYFYNKPFFSILTICSQEDLTNQALAANLQIGREALWHAIGRIPYSSNYYSRENAFFPLDTLDQIEKQFGDCRELFTEKAQELALSNERNNRFQLLQRVSSASDFFFVGNCSEITSLVFEYLIKQGCMPVEMYTIRGGSSQGGHTIATLGNKECDPAAIVIDAWRRHIYPAKYLPVLLEDCLGCKTFEGRPVFAKFDPEHQTLNLACQYVVSADNYYDKSLSNRDLNEIKMKLRDFHNTTDKDEKKKLASSLITNLHSRIWKTRSSLQLKSQLDLFLKADE